MRLVFAGIAFVASALFAAEAGVAFAGTSDFHQVEPYAFAISREDLPEIAQKLALRVDLFREVWKADPEAEFYAGTTRDYLYWILGHFRGLKTADEIKAQKKKLLSLRFIKFLDMVGPMSDADIMTHNRSKFSHLKGSDFGIRKLDFISFDRINPKHPLGKTEIDQGFIRVEKLRLSQNGLVDDKTFGGGVQDLIEGRLHIQFPDPKEFWETYYAQTGSNHPVLLVVRYLRIISQDYLRRHGDGYPDISKLFAAMSPEVQVECKKIISEAIGDYRFDAFLQNKKGLSWLNGSIQKSFRSFNNANATFELMKQMGVLRLIEAYPKKIESIFDYLLKVKRDKKKIKAAFDRMGSLAKEVYRPLEEYLPDCELIHGAGSELAFRSLVFQGVIPSERGSAGRGLYGVPIEELEFAKAWSRNRAQVDDIVVGLELEKSTKIIDITKDQGRALFSKWLARGGSGDLDTFAELFGADLIVFSYESGLLKNQRVMVLKNAAVIKGKRGIFKHPRPLKELEREIRRLSKKWKASDQKDIFDLLPILSDLFMTPLMRGERKYLLSLLPASFAELSLEKKNWDTLFDALDYSTALWLAPLVEGKNAKAATDFMIRLLTHKKDYVRSQAAQSLKDIRVWPKEIWAVIPKLERDLWSYVQEEVGDALATQMVWPKGVWTEFPFLLGNPRTETQRAAARALVSQKIWPEEVWRLVNGIMRDNDDEARNEMVRALANQKIWSKTFMQKVPELLRSGNPSVQDGIVRALAAYKNWPDYFTQEIPEILRHPLHRVRDAMVAALRSRSQIPKTCKDVLLEVGVPVW